MLRVDQVTATALGSGGGRVFRRGEPIKELTNGDWLDLLHWAT